MAPRDRIQLTELKSAISLPAEEGSLGLLASPTLRGDRLSHMLKALHRSGSQLLVERLRGRAHRGALDERVRMGAGAVSVPGTLRGAHCAVAVTPRFKMRP
jgi:hypothetical protein